MKFTISYNQKRSITKNILNGGLFDKLLYIRRQIFTYIFRTRTISTMLTYIYIERERVDVVEWSRALDVRLSEWYCSVSMVWVQIPSREEQKIDSSKI